MKILFQQIPKFNILNTRYQTPIKEESSAPEPNLAPKGLNISQFHNISFGAKKHDAEFLLKFSDKFRCAYSGREMISKSKFKEICKKLDKRPNAQSAYNLLQHLQKYMHNIEGIIFDIIGEASHKNKRNFQDILLELAPESLQRLEIRQIEILHSTDKILSKLSEKTALQVLDIRDEALAKMGLGTFGRQEPLKKLREIQADKKDLYLIDKIYKKWYELPTSARDIDAFIVQYSKHTHSQISKRLISSAVATIEHIKPQSKNGSSGLGNLILVSAQYNNSRSSMPLCDYMKLNPDLPIAENLQKYIDTVIKEVQNSKSEFSQQVYYPESIKKAIEQETGSKVQLDTSALTLTKVQKQEQVKFDKLREKYAK